MKRKVFAIALVAVLLVAIVASCVACNMFKKIKLDEVKPKLESAGYTVTVLSGEVYCEGENPYWLNSATLQQYLKGTKGNDIIEIFFFDSTDSASRASEFIHTSEYTGQSNEVFYIATKQARNDAGLG